MDKKKAKTLGRTKDDKHATESLAYNQYKHANIHASLEYLHMHEEAMRLGRSISLWGSQLNLFLNWAE